MVNHSSGYNAVMELSKSPSRYYNAFGIKSDWLDVVNACHLVQIEQGEGKEWVAGNVTSRLKLTLNKRSYFPGLTNLVKRNILRVRNASVGIGKKTEPWYEIVDTNGVGLALRESIMNSLDLVKLIDQAQHQSHRLQECLKADDWTGFSKEIDALENVLDKLSKLLKDEEHDNMHS